jgi:hypothetical protein
MPDYRADHNHFVDRHQVLEIDCHTRVTDVFQQLSNRPRAGIIVREKDKPKQHVDAHQLADAYLVAARKNSNVSDLDLHDFLKSWRDPKHPVEQVGVSRIIADTSKDATGQLLDIGTKRTDHVVFPVVENGKVIGYLYSHETFKFETDTPPPQFVCTGPVIHVNRDPDSGTCYSCPWPVVKAPR